MSKPAISIENLSKAFRIGEKQEKCDTLAGQLASIARAPFSNLSKLKSLDTRDLRRENQNIVDTSSVYWALKDVNLQIDQGDIVGILGSNGAGKSTLLKVLSKITKPTLGTVRIRGRVGSLLEVGTGFHPELTGRENIFMNGTILGMTKREIAGKLDEIIDFSGVEKFLDTPTKRWSSGMRVRLAFAVAANLEPEILIVDEVLAVGDLAFQKKCLGKMQDVSRQGRTILFVSHNMGAIKLLCKSAVILDSGRLTESGTAHSIIEKHIAQQINNTVMTPLGERTDRGGDGRAILQKVEILNHDMTPSSNLYVGRDAAIRITISLRDKSATPNRILIVCNNQDGVKIWSLDTASDYPETAQEPISEMLTIHLPRVNLSPGDYVLNICLSHGQDFMDIVDSAASFRVMAGDYYKTEKITENRGGAIFVPYEVSEKY